MRTVIGAVPGGGSGGRWSRDDELGRYVAEAMRHHMAEAVLPDPRVDEDAVLWLDSDDDVLSSPIVKAASDVVGAGALLEMAKAYEADGDAWRARSEASLRHTRRVDGLHRPR